MYIACCFPLLVPSTCGLLKGLHGSFVLIAVGSQLNLSFLKLCLIFAFLLSHYHVTLSQVTLDAKAVLFVTIPSLTRSAHTHRDKAGAQQTLLTTCVCCTLSLWSRSIPFWIIFLLSFSPLPKAANGSSSSVFIWPAMAECAFAIASVSPRTTSREFRRDPVSHDPKVFRHNAWSFRAYSSSIAART